MFKLAFIIILFFLSPIILNGQNCSCNNSVYIKNAISKLNSEKNTKGIYTLIEGLERKDNKACVGIAVNHAVSLLFFENEYAKCLALLKRVSPFLNEHCLDTLLAENYFLIGRNYFSLGRMDSSQVYFIKSAELAEQIKAYKIQVNALSDICWVFQNFGQHDKALSYLKKALAISLKNNDTKGIGILYSNLAAAYGEVYGVTNNLKYLDSVLLSLNNGIALHRKERNEQSIQFMYVTFANVYLSKKDYTKALAYCDSVTSMDFIEDANKYVVYSIKSNVFKQIGNKSFALKYADSCYQAASLIASPYEMVTILNELIQCHKDIGNIEMALSLMEKLMRFKDSTNILEVNTKVNELEQKYNKAQNETRISELNKQNEIASLNLKILAVAIFAAVLVILIIIFFYRQSMLKNKFKALETEQRLNRARMNPHFFFNALASIQTLSMDTDNQLKVSTLISKFSKIMRQSLESTYDELATIEDEILFLSNYLDLQKNRFNNKFEYEIKTDENIAQDELKIPSMLLQPFLENSIEHGFKNIDYKGKLDIAFKKEENGIRIELKDNGKGFDTSQKHKEYPSRATQIIADRFLILNKHYSSNAKFEFATNSDGKGVRVQIWLPIIY